MKKSSAMILGAWLLLTGMFPMLAQDVPPPPPEKPDRPEKPDGDRPGDRPGDRQRWSEGSRGMPGMPGGGPSGMRHGDKDRMDAFKQLTEEEREKVRAAFEKVWKNPEITAARERLTKANDEYREVFHKAMQDADPEVARILSKIKPPMPPEGGPMMGKPDLNEPDFPQKAPQRLAFELQMMTRGRNQDVPIAQLHEKFLKLPAVQEALQKLREVDVNGRDDAWRKLRDAYQSAAKLELGIGRKDGDPRPPDPGR